MKTTQNLEMKIPEGGDPIDIADITGNFEKLDTEIAKKANASGGDISAMAVKTLDTIAAEFPVPSAGESSKTFLGKVRKFVQDFNNFKTGILTLGRLVNNGQTTEPGFALDARYGKTLYDLYAQLNVLIEAIGNFVYNTTANVTAVNGISTKLYYIVLEPGIWSIESQITWDTNATGFREHVVRQGSQWNSTMLAGNSHLANPITTTHQNCSAIAVLTVPTEISVWGLQNSGSELNFGGTVKAVRLK